MMKFRVWHIPQVGMKQIFYVPVPDAETGKLVMNALAQYDLFQFENKVKPDYANAQGLECADDDDEDDWTEYNEEDYFLEFEAAFEEHGNFAPRSAAKYISTLGQGLRFRNAQTGASLPAAEAALTALDDLQIHMEDIETFAERLVDQRERHAFR